MFLKFVQVFRKIIFLEKIWLLHVINAVVTAGGCFYSFKYLEQDLTLLLPLLAGFLLLVFSNAVRDGTKALYYLSGVLILFNILFVSLVSYPKSLLRQPELKWILVAVIVTNLTAAIRYGVFQFKGK